MRRMIVTGDPTPDRSAARQEIRAGRSAALLDGVEGVAIVRFNDVDVVRHPLVAESSAPMTATRRSRAAWAHGRLMTEPAQTPRRVSAPAVEIDMLVEAGAWPPELQLRVQLLHLHKVFQDSDLPEANTIGIFSHRSDHLLTNHISFRKTNKYISTFHGLFQCFYIFDGGGKTFFVHPNHHDQQLKHLYCQP